MATKFGTKSAITRLISFLHLIFAVLLPNLIRPIVCQIFSGSRDYDTPLFVKMFYRACSAFERRSGLCTKFEVPSSSSFRRRPTTPLGESYLCIQSAFHMRICWPNLKSVAQIIFKIFGVV